MSIHREMNMLQSGARISKRLAETFTALASERRLDILSAVSRSGEMDVSTLCDLLRRSQPAISHDLRILRLTGLINCRRDGQHNYYRVESKLLRDLEMGLSWYRRRVEKKNKRTPTRSGISGTRDTINPKGDVRHQL